ncbi:MAG TPA: DUF2061 domain-containing protein [Caulobacteraceae bacterium]|nr:DUF2061 domain-containing protein [Caulobacteraceae bacterium]
MFFRAPEAHSRSLVKAVSWRLLGSMDTFIISFFVTGKLTFALSIASVETFTKIALYYFHERIWAMVPFGRPAAATSQPAPAEAAPATTAKATAA